MVQDATAGKLLVVGSRKGLGQGDQLPHTTITHAIVDIFAAPLTRYKATPAETLQVDRNTPLRGPGVCDQLAHILLALQQHEQDPQAGWVADAGKDSGDQVDLARFRKLIESEG